MCACVIFVVSLHASTSSAQKLTPGQIDSLLIKEASYIVQSKSFDEALKWNDSLLLLSKKQHYTRGVLLAKLNIANRYWNYGKLDECIGLLNEIKKTAETELPSDVYIMARVCQYYSQAYNTLALFPLSLDNNLKAISFALKIDSANVRNSVISNIYLTRSNIFNNLKQSDSSKYYLLKSYELKKNAVVLVTLASYYMQQDVNDDSAKRYLDKAMAYINNKEKRMREYDKSVTYFTYGKYYLNKHNYGLATEYMEKALAFGLNKKNYNHLSDIYRHLVLCYKRLDNIVMENKYLAKYNELKDSINESQARLIEDSIKKIEEQENKVIAKNKTLFIYTSCGIIIISGLLIALIRNNRKKQKKLLAKEAIIRKNMELLEMKHEEVELLKKRVEAEKAFIMEKEEEAEVLKRKINNITDELKELAQDNDPLLLSKFQEAYPEIINKLLSINPGLTQPDLVFCIYLWLGFSSKEIANYTFTQHRSMQTKKNRLRKKLDLSSEVDLYLFLRNEL